MKKKYPQTIDSMIYDIKDFESYIIDHAINLLVYDIKNNRCGLLDINNYIETNDSKYLPNLSSEQIRALRHIFTIFDTNRDNNLDYFEFEIFYSSCFLNKPLLSKNEFLNILFDIRKKYLELISFDTFCIWIKKIIYDNENLCIVWLLLYSFGYREYIFSQDLCLDTVPITRRHTIIIRNFEYFGWKVFKDIYFDWKKQLNEYLLQNFQHCQVIDSSHHRQYTNSCYISDHGFLCSGDELLVINKVCICVYVVYSPTKGALWYPHYCIIVIHLFNDMCAYKGLRFLQYF